MAPLKLFFFKKKRNQESVIVEFNDLDDSLDAYFNLIRKSPFGNGLKVEMGRPKTEEPKVISFPFFSFLTYIQKKKKKKPADSSEVLRILQINFPSGFPITAEKLQKEFRMWKVTVKLVPQQSYALVYFPNKEQAQEAKKQLSGKLFDNHPEITITHNVEE